MDYSKQSQCNKLYNHLEACTIYTVITITIEHYASNCSVIPPPNDARAVLFVAVFVRLYIHTVAPYNTQTLLLLLLSTFTAFAAESPAEQVYIHFLPNRRIRNGAVLGLMSRNAFYVFRVCIADSNGQNVNQQKIARDRFHRRFVYVQRSSHDSFLVCVCARWALRFTRRHYTVCIYICS